MTRAWTNGLTGSSPRLSGPSPGTGLSLNWRPPFGLSASRFAHLFRSCTGVSPARFLRHLRLDRARMLLENTTLGVREVMRLVGWTDPSHFARDYRDRHGLRPRDSRIGRRKGTESRNGWRTPNENRHGDRVRSRSAKARYAEEV